LVGQRETVQAVSERQPTDPPSPLRASHLLRNPAVWVPPAVMASLLVFIMTLVYFGSIVNPSGHLHGLPVSIVDQDAGATVGAKHVDYGAEITAGLTHSHAVSSRLALDVQSLAAAKHRMNLGKAYATVVIPRQFTASLLTVAGLSESAGAGSSLPTIELLTNPRAGTLGVSLATEVLRPALAHASNQIGSELRRATSTQPANAATRAVLSDPITVASVAYRPLPSHSGLGLSAFYIALLTTFCGFLGAVIVNTSVDVALGYATTEVGPMWRQRLPIAISRWQTLLTKWSIAVVLTLLLTGLMLAAAVGILNMNTPHFADLWLLAWFAAAVVAIGTLALFAALGNLGQLVAILVFVYLALASSGGTVPIEALSGFYRFIANFEPLRQILGGVRAILYLNAQGAAGLTRAWVATALGLVFWVAVGAAITIWYDRRGLDRMSPDLLEYVNRAASDYVREDRRSPAGHGAGRDAAAGDAAGRDVAGRDVAGGDVAGGDVARGDVARGDAAGGDVAGGDVAGNDAPARPEDAPSTRPPAP
jgi:YhgE/Pip-like protein